MKRKKSLTMLWCGAAAAMLLGGCSKEAAEPGRYGDGEGSLTISAVSMPQIAVNDATRADGPTLALTSIVPDASKFTEKWAMESLRTRVVCVEDDAAYEAHAFASANAYNDENPRLTPVPAKYSVTMGMPKADGKLHDYTMVTGPDAPRYREKNKDPETQKYPKLVPVVPEGEGVNFIYFEGYATATVESGTEPKEVEVEVKVANTAVTVEFTEAFCKYFANGAAITLTTKGGFTKEIASYEAGETPAQASKHYFWVRPQAFTLTGVATPQTPSPGHIEAEPVALKFEMTDDKVDPQTLYRMTFDAKTTGASGAITVTVDDTVIDTVDLGYEELNPNPKND